MGTNELFYWSPLRVGCNTGIERVVLFSLLLCFSGMAFSQAELKPVPAPSSSSFPPAANSGSMAAANDADFAKAARATAVTSAAEQSGFGKVMSRIFSKRALAAGLRGTPQAVAVGLALEAAMSYFSKDDKPVSQDFPTGPFLGNETWADVLLDKGLITRSDVEVHAFEENKNIKLTTDGYVSKLNGAFYLTTSDGSTVIRDSGEIAYFGSSPLKPVFVTVPDNVEPYVFKPSPVYQMNDFSCPSDVYRGGRSDSGDEYKFQSGDEQGKLFSNNLTSLAACTFYGSRKTDSSIVSFSVSGYDADLPLPFGYSLISKMKVNYDYKDFYFDPISKKAKDIILKKTHGFNISLTPSFEKKVVPRILPDYVVSQQAEKITEPLPASVMKDVVNNVLMNVALQPDYQGVPFSPFSPVTVEELNQAVQEAAVPLTKGMLYQQTNYYPPFESPLGEQEPGLNQGQSNPSQRPDYSEEVSPDSLNIKYPELDMPTAEQILQPYKSFFSFLQDFSLPSRSAQYPVWDVLFYGNSYKIDSHCPLIEENKGVIQSVFALVWAFIALRKLLSA